MFGIGMPEMILLLALALIVIGPKKLPDLARSMGRAMREFKKATGELKDSLELDEEFGEVKKSFNDIRQDLKDSADVKGRLKNAVLDSDAADHKDSAGGEAAGTKMDGLKKAFDELNKDNSAQSAASAEDASAPGPDEPPASDKDAGEKAAKE